jgi:hypothetical protein
MEDAAQLHAPAALTTVMGGPNRRFAVAVKLSLYVTKHYGETSGTALCMSVVAKDKSLFPQ